MAARTGSRCLTAAAVRAVVATRSGRWEPPTSGQEGAHAAALLGFRLLTVRNRCEGSGGDVRPLRVWKTLLGLHRMVIEEVELDDMARSLVVSVRPRARERDRCPHCRRRCPGYDQGEGRRRWRALDLGTTLCFLEADAPRVRCKRHGVVVAAVPWARHDAGFTRCFEDQIAWLAVNTGKTAVSQLMRIAWRIGRLDLQAGDARGPGAARLLPGLSAWGSMRSRFARVRGTSRSWSTTTPAGSCGRTPAAISKTVEKFLDLLGQRPL